MGETSDIQSVVARTQLAGRIQNLAAETEEARRKRFELERAKEIAENPSKISQSLESATPTPVDRDERPKKGKESPKGNPEGEKPSSSGRPESEGGSIDVRI